MSVYFDILSAVHTAVKALHDNTHIRKQIESRKQVDTYPLIVISPGEEAIESEQFGKGVVLTYPVVVALIQPTSLLLTDLEWQLDMRETIRQALWVTTLSGASTVFNVDYEPSPAFDLAGLDSGLDASLQLFTYHSRETRDGS